MSDTVELITVGGENSNGLGVAAGIRTRLTRRASGGAPSRLPNRSAPGGLNDDLGRV